MNRLTVLALAAAIAPVSVSAATIAAEGGGPYDVTSDTLFTGIVTSAADGPGSYVLDFFTPGETIIANADAAVTPATVNISFSNLTMSWVDGLNLNTLVASSGVDELSTTFDTDFPVQQLVFDWTDSDAGSGFRFDVETEFAAIAPIPVPASVLLLGSALAGAGIFGRKRKAMCSATV